MATSTSQHPGWRQSIYLTQYQEVLATFVQKPVHVHVAMALYPEQPVIITETPAAIDVLLQEMPISFDPSVGDPALEDQGIDLWSGRIVAAGVAIREVLPTYHLGMEKWAKWTEKVLRLHQLSDAYRPIFLQWLQPLILAYVAQRIIEDKTMHGQWKDLALHSISYDGGLIAYDQTGESLVAWITAILWSVAAGDSEILQNLVLVSDIPVDQPILTDLAEDCVVLLQTHRTFPRFVAQATKILMALVPCIKADGGL